MLRQHTHRCEKCGHVWAHDRSVGIHNEAAHTCPKCGAGPWWYVDGLVGKGGKIISADDVGRYLMRKGYDRQRIYNAIEAELDD